MKINFIVCGVQKSGTTALAHFLRQHPEICFCKQKEVHFFDKEEVFEKEPVDYSFYHRFFDLYPETKIIGEVTPIYIYWQPCMERIWKYNSAMKLIVVLRKSLFSLANGE